jgi:hypothetical protein
MLSAPARNAVELLNTKAAVLSATPAAILNAPKFKTEGHEEIFIFMPFYITLNSPFFSYFNIKYFTNSSCFMTARRSTPIWKR